MTLWPLLVFLFPFFGTHASLFASVYMRENERESEGRIHGDRKIKHHMMGTVIASETTKHIKNPLPFSHVLLPHPLPLMELLPYLS